MHYNEERKKKTRKYIPVTGRNIKTSFWWVGMKGPARPLFERRKELKHIASQAAGTFTDEIRTHALTHAANSY